MNRRLGSLAVALVLAALPATSFAQGTGADLATARQLGLEAQTALDAKDYKTAEDKFKRADQLYGGGKDVHAPTLLLGLARAEMGLGHYVAAQENYNRIIRDGSQPGAPAAFAKAVEDARKEVDAATPHIGGVVVNVTGAPEPKVLLDDAITIPSAALGIKRAIDPGNHVIKATADGYKPAEKSFTVTEGAAAPTTVDIALEKDPNAVVAAPTPPPGGGNGHGAGPSEPPPATSGGSTTKTLAFAAFGVGAAGLVVGSVAGVLAISKHADLANNCKGPDGTCTDPNKAKQSDIDSYHTVGTVSTIGFIVAGVGAAAGAVLLIVAPKAEVRTGSTVVQPYVGLGSVGALGRF